jgi:hypothetical protein
MAASHCSSIGKKIWAVLVVHELELEGQSSTSNFHLTSIRNLVVGLIQCLLPHARLINSILYIREWQLTNRAYRMGTFPNSWTSLATPQNQQVGELAGLSRIHSQRLASLDQQV